MNEASKHESKIFQLNFEMQLSYIHGIRLVLIFKRFSENSFGRINILSHRSEVHFEPVNIYTNFDAKIISIFVHTQHLSQHIKEVGSSRISHANKMCQMKCYEGVTFHAYLFHTFARTSSPHHSNIFLLNHPNR